jgi:hypothetical protein
VGAEICLRKVKRDYLAGRRVKFFTWGDLTHMHCFSWTVYKLLFLLSLTRSSRSCCSARLPGNSCTAFPGQSTNIFFCFRSSNRHGSAAARIRLETHALLFLDSLQTSFSALAHQIVTELLQRASAWKLMHCFSWTVYKHLFLLSLIRSSRSCCSARPPGTLPRSRVQFSR